MSLAVLACWNLLQNSVTASSQAIFSGELITVGIINSDMKVCINAACNGYLLYDDGTFFEYDSTAHAAGVNLDGSDRYILNK